MQVINNKYTFIPIVIGLAVSFILLITSIVLRVINYGYVPEIDPNPTHELLHDGVLYFYDKHDKQIGTYECKANFKYCGLALETYDDEEYGFNFYDDGKVDYLKVENERYAFIVDSETTYEKPEDAPIMLYDFKNKKVIKEFSAVKDYTVGLSDNIVFAKEQNGGWRIIILKGPNMTYLTDYSYEYVAVSNNINPNTGVLDASNIVTFDGKLWQLINDIGVERTTKTNEKIYDYNNNYIIYSVNDLYQLRTLSNYSLLNGNSFKMINFIPGYNTYAEIKSIEGEYYIIDYTYNRIKSNHYYVSEYPDIKASLNSYNEVEIKTGDTILETVK